MKIFKTVVSLSVLMLFSCNYSILYNPYKLLDNGKTWNYSGTMKIKNNTVKLTTSRIESRYYKKGSEIIFFTQLVNESQDTILVEKNTFKVVSSSGDTSSLFLINTTKHNNLFLKVNPLLNEEVILVFKSKKQYSYEEYKNAFKKDTIYLYCLNQETSFILKGDRIRRDSVNY